VDWEGEAATMSGMETYRTPAGHTVPACALRFSFARSGGPGGQHVNTSSTKVRATLDVTACGLDTVTLERVVAVIGSEISVAASASRSQARNRAAAITQVLTRLDDAAAVPTERVATLPTAASRQRRLETKRHQSQRKADRRTRLEVQ
jgi:ribosome-associated protein